MVKRRWVLYVHGYDPQGPAGYYRLFSREWKKFCQVWPVTSELGELQVDSDDLAHWNISTAGRGWKVTTRYEFLRYDEALKANLSQPIMRQIGRALRWLADDIVSGAGFRIMGASWRFWMHLFVLQQGLLLWLGLPILVAAWVAWALGAAAGMGLPIGLAAAAAVAVLVFVALWPVAERTFVIRVNNCWPYLREFGRGEPTCFDRPIEIGADRLLFAARSNVADEIVVVGHSGGGPVASAVVARALQLDPELGRRGPSVVLVTLGSVMPAVALHPEAQPMRDIVRRIATEPSIRWIDCQSRKDPMNFWDFDPVEGLGVHAGAERCNPQIWAVRFRDMLSAEFYRRIRANFFRLHYQFIMAGDRPAPYDYFMLVCGPEPVSACAEARSLTRIVDVGVGTEPARQSARPTLDNVQAGSSLAASR